MVKKIFLAVLILSLIGLSAITSCKKTEEAVIEEKVEPVTFSPKTGLKNGVRTIKK